MPRHLSPESKKFWRAHAPALERRGILTALDEMAFANLCEAWATIQLMEKTIQRDGMILTGPRGKVSQHPLLREKSRWQRLFITSARDFGMTPSSRRRLGIPADADPEEDEFFRLLDGGKAGDKPDK